MTKYLSKLKFKKKTRKINKRKHIQNGGSKKSVKVISCADNYEFFNNLIGTCWMISTLMILLMNNTIALQNIITFNKDIFNPLQYKYVTLLPNYFFTDDTKNTIKPDYLKLLKDFFVILKERLDNKKYQQHYNNVLTEFTTKKLSKSQNLQSKSLPRRNSLKSSQENVPGESCEIKLNTIFFSLFNEKNQIGGFNYDKFNLQLLLSIFLCDELYNFTIYNFYKENIYNNIDNIIGIDISIPKHSMSFYRCNNTLMFCTNELTKP